MYKELLKEMSQRLRTEGNISIRTLDIWHNIYSLQKYKEYPCIAIYEDYRKRGLDIICFSFMLIVSAEIISISELKIHREFSTFNISIISEMCKMFVEKIERVSPLLSRSKKISIITSIPLFPEILMDSGFELSSNENAGTYWKGTKLNEKS